jgi:mRNA interferase MazF
VRLPESTIVTGVVLADQLKSLDWQKRNAAFISHLDTATTQEVIKKIHLLLLF